METAEEPRHTKLELKKESWLSSIVLKIMWVSKSMMLITILESINSISIKTTEESRYTQLSWNVAVMQYSPENHENMVTESVNHANHDSGKKFVLRGVDWKGKTGFLKGRKLTFINRPKDHVSEQVDDAVLITILRENC